MSIPGSGQKRTYADAFNTPAPAVEGRKRGKSLDESSKSAFGPLPEELTLHILSLLDVNALIASHLVSKDFHRIGKAAIKGKMEEELKAILQMICDTCERGCIYNKAKADYDRDKSLQFFVEAVANVYPNLAYEAVDAMVNPRPKVIALCRVIQTQMQKNEKEKAAQTLERIDKILEEISMELNNELQTEILFARLLIDLNSTPHAPQSLYDLTFEERLLDLAQTNPLLALQITERVVEDKPRRTKFFVGIFKLLAKKDPEWVLQNLSMIELADNRDRISILIRAANCLVQLARIELAENTLKIVSDWLTTPEGKKADPELVLDTLFWMANVQRKISKDKAKSTLLTICGKVALLRTNTSILVQQFTVRTLSRLVRKLIQLDNKEVAVDFFNSYKDMWKHYRKDVTKIFSKLEPTQVQVVRECIKGSFEDLFLSFNVFINSAKKEKDVNKVSENLTKARHLADLLLKSAESIEVVDDKSHGMRTFCIDIYFSCLITLVEAQNRLDRRLAAKTLSEAFDYMTKLDLTQESQFSQPASAQAKRLVPVFTILKYQMMSKIASTQAKLALPLPRFAIEKMADGPAKIQFLINNALYLAKINTLMPTVTNSVL